MEIKVLSKFKSSHWRRSGVFIVNFEHVSHLFLVFLLLTFNKKMLAGLRFTSHVQCHRLIFTVNYNWFVVVILQLNCYHSWNIFANYLATPYSHNYSFSTSLQIAPNAISTNKEGTQIVVGGRNCKWRFTIGILIRDVTKVFIDQCLDS